MMRGRVFFALVLLAGQTSSAQQVIQQPVVSVTSVNTTVSVPDRGSALLGGVSSAQSGRSQYGPFRSGTATGLSRHVTSISASVRIHDLQAMDEAILNSGSPSSAAGESRRTVLSNGEAANDLRANVVASPAENAAKFELLARKADAAGKRGVAKLHWQMAAKYGSKYAGTRLAELSQPSSPPSPRTAMP